MEWGVRESDENIIEMCHVYVPPAHKEYSHYVLEACTNKNKN